MPFIKMHGLGNDFVVIDDFTKPAGFESPINEEIAIRMCDRRLGVGADQLLWIRKPSEDTPKADCEMLILNNDGSSAEMCGNGIRAVALLLYREGPKPKQKKYSIQTLAGLLEVEFPKEGEVRVSMGTAKLGEPAEKIRSEDRDFQFQEVSVGNPHAVIFLKEDLEKFPLEKYGRPIEIHSRFPKRTNVEFVEVVSRSKIRVRVWERGAGATLACGTGACAAAASAIAQKLVDSPVQVQLPGGELTISWTGKASDPVFMQGPATEVYRGEFRI
ncbi:diaminopimelate epimerase [bacterium]|nr:diaminopimelate epimerase [bacterium]